MNTDTNPERFDITLYRDGDIVLCLSPISMQTIALSVSTLSPLTNNATGRKRLVLHTLRVQSPYVTHHEVISIRNLSHSRSVNGVKQMLRKAISILPVTIGCVKNASRRV